MLISPEIFLFLYLESRICLCVTFLIFPSTLEIFQMTHQCGCGDRDCFTNRGVKGGTAGVDMTWEGER